MVVKRNRSEYPGPFFVSDPLWNSTQSRFPWNYLDSPSPRLLKRNGKAVRSGNPVIPQGVNDGGALRRFPNHLVSPLSKGLYNEGNFCYRNAALQGLLHVPAFYRFLGSTHKDCDREIDDCVVCALQSLATQYWGDEPLGKEVGPQAAVRGLNSACMQNLPLLESSSLSLLREDFIALAQSDSMDFIEYLLRELEKTVRPEDEIPLEGLFQIAQQDEWRCDECQFETIKSLTAEERGASAFAIDVHIHQPPHRTLVEHLEAAFNEQKNIHCGSQWCSAEYPDRRQDGPLRDYRSFITKLPEILIIRLARFNFEQTAPDRHGRTYPVIYRNGTYNQVKVASNVIYEKYLNLSEQTLEGPILDTIYRLDAVISHNGRSSKSGHHICTAREPNTSRFVQMNDALSVTQSWDGRFTEMRAPVSLSTSFDPYILIYSRVT